MNRFWGADLARVRTTWELDDDVVHLNHGSFGAVPVAALAEQRRLRALMERDPDRWFRRLPGLVTEARLAIAGYLRAEPDALALVPNASAGVTAVLNGLATGSGRIVYTDHAYGAVEMAVHRASRRLGLSAHRVHIPPAADTSTVVSLLGDAIEGPTSLVIVDQISSATARCFPVREIAALCRERGVPLLVDGAHAPGMLGDPLAGINADLWVGNLHKWSCAPLGTAAIVAAAPWRDRLLPLIASWSSDEPYPQRFDVQGTLDMTAWLAAPTAFVAVAALDADRVRRHNSALAEHGQRVVSDALGVPVPDIGDPAPSMRLVTLPPHVGATTADCHALQARIADEAGCEVAITHWQGRGHLRLSAHAYNTPDDYHLLADRLPAVLRGFDQGGAISNACLKL